ncbi:MAG: cob(I)yrinic acid a,c-diamide adenosyltransferase [Leptospiraceae bacterium]|nr:cob(I)yrinic acid a,c-diamide adenosyltransferase [Leptospiraceae bacterium]MCK6380761.1 cob(I)yrinic acid a,c-diamide adenosyltransferase [Leptospiraceae bacterium]NUM41131.1 cob(I)yrinic acid a,c-diamide adenosyltransferase [Leptospiraceae bacterium]
MKIYTKTGDKGQTSLASGKRVSKSSPKVDLYGTCDELNSTVGIVISFLPEGSKIISDLTQIQNILFELGSELAGYKNQERESALLQSDVQFLENSIDKMQESLSPIKNFILPGGSQPSSFLHLSRTICRRLERKMVLAIETGDSIPEISIQYINRLSDYFFVAARFSNFENGLQDIFWEAR